MKKINISGEFEIQRFIYLISVLFLAALALNACGGEATTTPPQIEQSTEATEAPEAEEPSTAPEEEAPAASEGSELPAINPAEYTGDVVSAGSSAVFSLAEVIASLYESEVGGNISIGSGAGFERFCEAGERDVSNASRAIKDSEVESCAAIGRTPSNFEWAPKKKS